MNVREHTVLHRLLEFSSMKAIAIARVTQVVLASICVNCKEPEGMAHIKETLQSFWPRTVWEEAERWVCLEAALPRTTTQGILFCQRDHIVNILFILTSIIIETNENCHD